MKQKGRTANLKQRVLAFAFCCLCVFVYSEQTSVLGSDTVQVVAPDKCCKNCGSVGYCLLGTDYFNADYSMGFEDCDLILHPDTGDVIGCEVSGEFCGCSGDE